MDKKRKENIRSLASLKGGYELIVAAGAFLVSELFVTTTSVFANVYSILKERGFDVAKANALICIGLTIMLIAGVVLFLRGLRKRYFQFEIRDCLKLEARSEFRNGWHLAVIIIISAIATIGVLQNTTTMGFTTIKNIVVSMGSADKVTNTEVVREFSEAAGNAIDLVSSAITMVITLLKKLSIYLLLTSTVHAAVFLVNRYNINEIIEEFKVPRLRIVSYKDVTEEQLKRFYDEDYREELTTRVSRRNTWNGDYRLWLNCIEAAHETAQAFDHALPFVFFVKEKGSDEIVGSINVRWYKKPQEGPTGFHVIIDLIPSKHNDINLRVLIKAVKRRAKARYVEMMYFYTDSDNVAFRSAADVCKLQKLDHDDGDDIYTWLGVVSSKYDSLI